MLRFLTAGEAHGPALAVIVEGLPAGVRVARAEVGADLSRYLGGLDDEAFDFLAGVRHGVTLGSPLAVMVGNPGYRDSWVSEMAPDPRPSSLSLTRPRPGTADLVGMLKFGVTDVVAAAERSHARPALGHVVAGSLARCFLRHLDIEVGGQCRDTGDGFEIRATGLPAGLGSYTHWDRAVDGLLAQALISVDRVVGVEFGDRSPTADSITWREEEGYGRASNHSGGVEGGMTTGEPVVLSAVVAPPPAADVGTVDVLSKEAVEEPSVSEPPPPLEAVSAVGEAMVALVLASEVLRKTGGDSLEEVRQHLTTYRRMSRWA